MNKIILFLLFYLFKNIMLSNRTANFKTSGEKEEIKVDDNKEQFMKQLTTPMPKFDKNYYFLDEEEKEASSISFQKDLLDKKAYKFIKPKDECLSAMELDDSIPQ